MNDYTALPNLVSRGYRSDQRVALRAWEPGDGLLCSHASSKAGIRCGVPVAVVVKEWDDTVFRRGARRDVGRARTFVVCTTHVADVVRQYILEGNGTIPGIATEAQRKAKEAVITAHWDEYQSRVEAELTSMQDEAISVLPESVQALVRAARAEADG